MCSALLRVAALAASAAVAARPAHAPRSCLPAMRPAACLHTGCGGAAPVPGRVHEGAVGGHCVLRRWGLLVHVAAMRPQCIICATVSLMKCGRGPGAAMRPGHATGWRPLTRTSSTLSLCCGCVGCVGCVAVCAHVCRGLACNPQPHIEAAGALCADGRRIPSS